MTQSNRDQTRPCLGERPASPNGAPDPERRLDTLLEATVAEMLAVERKPDPMFGRHGEAVALAHLAYGHEARLIEGAATLLCEAEPHLRVVRLDRPFPLVAAAFEALRGNDWATLEGIRLPSRVFAEDSYMPDLVALDRRSSEVFLFDIKRAVDNKASRVRALMTRLKAAALVAPDWLSMQEKVHGVGCTRIAILDASGAVDEPRSGIMPLAALEQVLDIPGFAARIADLRRRFATRLEEEMDRLLPLMPEPAPDAAASNGAAAHRARTGSGAPGSAKVSDGKGDRRGDADLAAAGEAEIGGDANDADGGEIMPRGRGCPVGFAIPAAGPDKAVSPPAAGYRH